jgi:Fe-S-cluster containining protein
MEVGKVSRVPLRVVRDEPELVACTECGNCCTYVGVGINAPSRTRYATDILWYLYHEGVYVYLDGDAEWSVHFEARCRQLGDDLLCRIYEDRPHICRSFDNTTCEVNDLEHDALTFREPREFLDWLSKNKPRIYRKVEKRFLPDSLRPVARPKRVRSASRSGIPARGTGA